MRICFSMLFSIVALAAMWTMTPPVTFAMAAGEPTEDPRVDPGACVAAGAANNVDAAVNKCGAVIDNAKAPRADRVRALMTRADVFVRNGQDDRAIADYSAVVRFDPAQADAFNNRGEIFLRKGDRPHALADFGTALKLDPQHPSARNNYRALVQELERIGAQMPLKNKSLRP
jgi:Flp pilus assembly protein TadD